MFCRVSSSTLTAALLLAFVALSNFGVSAIPAMGLGRGSRFDVFAAAGGSRIEPGTFLPASIGIPNSPKLNSEDTNDNSSSSSEPQSQPSTTPNNDDDGDDTTTDSSSDLNTDNTSSDSSSSSSTTTSTSTSTSSSSDSSASPTPSPSSATTNAALPTHIPLIAIPLVVTILFGLF